MLNILKIVSSCFLSIGWCFIIEVLLNFFNMEIMDDCFIRNRFLYYVLDVGDNKKSYYYFVLDKFIDDFFILGYNIDE